MAYKYTKGNVRRGDIYNEDDTQGNTFIDWSEDAFGIVVGGELTLVVSGSVVNVSGSGIPLVVDGAVSSSGPLYGTDLVLKTNASSNIASIYIQGTSGTEIIGQSGGNMDIRSDGGTLNLLGGSGHALYLGSDSQTYRVTLDTDGNFGIGTTSPDYTLDVAGTVGVDEYIYHNGDADTFIRFEDDEINIKAGGAAMILAVEGSGGDQADKVTINDDQADVDFQVKGDGVANLLRTDASNDRVGINTDTPDYTLDVAGTVGIDEYIYHNEDADTFIRFEPDEINIKAGNVNFINITEGAQDKITFNDGGVDVDFIVQSPSGSKAIYLNSGNEVLHINHGDLGFKTKIHSTNGEAMTVNDSGVIINDEGHAANDFRVESGAEDEAIFLNSGTDELHINKGSSAFSTKIYGNYGNAMEVNSSGVTINEAGVAQNNFRVETDNNTHMVFVDAGNETVGIGTDSAASTFEVSGSQAGNYTQSAASLTIDETHFAVDYTGNGNATFTLPASSGVTGRQYHIICHAQDHENQLTVTGSGGAFQGAHLEGDQDSVTIDGDTPQSLSLISTGTNWFILHDGRSEE